MGSFGEVAVIILAVMAVLTAVVSRRKLNRFAIENERWRTLARQRADRVSMFSHEIKTPLALIVGSAEVLTQGQLGELNPRQRMMLETVMSNGYAMSALADDILAAARIDTQLFTMRMVNVDLRKLAQQVIFDLRKLHQNQLSLECRGFPPQVSGDPQLLRQVLINLVTNAVRHGGDGPISIGIRSAEDSVLLTVTDFGSGMTPRQRQEAFTRTMQGRSETGHGLGLIITGEIIELHGGQLLLDSDLAHGTTIMARIPLRAANLET